MEIAESSSYFYPVTMILLGSGIGFYYGYQYVKSYLNNYIIDRVMKELNKKQEDDGILFKQLERTKSAVICYKHGGKDHKVCVPYDRSKSRPMLRKKVFLVRNDDNEEKLLEITHKPGVPYLLSATEMGGSKIIVIKDSKIVKEYKKEDIPNFLD